MLLIIVTLLAQVIVVHGPESSLFCCDTSSTRGRSTLNFTISSLLLKTCAVDVKLCYADNCAQDHALANKERLLLYSTGIPYIGNNKLLH